MAIIDDNVLKVIMEVVLEDGTIAQNVFHFIAEFATSQSDSAVMTEIETWIEALYSDGSSFFPTTMTQRVCWADLIEWDSELGKWIKDRTVGYFTPTIGFNDANEPLPNQTSAFASFPTSRPKTTGRRFFFPWGEDAQDQTFLTGAALTALTNMADEALDVMNFGVGSDLIPGVPRVASGWFGEFESAIVTNVLGSQRRRRPGVGI